MRATIPKRTPKRSRVLLKGVLEGARGQQDVRIRDISPEGALVEGADPPVVEEQVRLCCGKSVLEARVAWTDGAWFGLEFLAPASDSLVEAVSGGLKVSAPRTYRRDRLQTPEEPD